MAEKKKKKNKVEFIKEESNFLKGNIKNELGDENPFVGKDTLQLLKFHGSYQQDDRDLRDGANRHYMFMIRARIPSGILTPDQYLAFDKLADTYGNGTFRITTRQSVQFHGIIKKDLKKTIQTINETLITTLGACGDVVRNVMCVPVPDIDGRQLQIQEYSKVLSDAFLPATPAYHEIWLDGEKLATTQEIKEPVYGSSYLPRKFKIGIVLPEDNSIDVYTQDVGLVPFFNDHNKLFGFNFIVGGGMGMSNNNPATYPRIGDHLGFVNLDDTLSVIKEIIGIQRDYGDRTNRKHARMKYLIDDWGFDQFKAELESRLGFKLDEFKEMPPFKPNLYLGWHKQANGKWFLGLSIENGRIKDADGEFIKTGLKNAVKKYRPGVRFTPNQNLILTDIEEKDRHSLEEFLSTYNITLPDQLSNVLKFSMACPALPTCGLAIAESERVFPNLIRQIEQIVKELHLEEEQLSVRMTGCPNGCARPYMADIGFVGRSNNKYSVYIGGNPEGTRLNKLYQDLVPFDQLVETVRPLLEHYKTNRNQDEAFSDFWQRIGFEEFAVTA